MATFCDISGCQNLSFRTDKKTRNHYCANHWKQYSTDIDRRSISQRAIDKNKSEKLHQETTKSYQVKMDLFWLSGIIELSKNPYCAECGSFIPPSYYHAAIAHVLPKRKEYGFPSVAANPLNRLFLGAGCSCHSRYDKSWEDASKMKVFPQAVEIFKKLYPLITESEHKNIPEILRQYINTDL